MPVGSPGPGNRNPDPIRDLLALISDASAHKAELERLAEAKQRADEATANMRTVKAEAEQAAETAKAATATQADIDALRNDLKAQIERAKIRENKAAKALAQGRDRMARTEAVWLDKPIRDGIGKMAIGSTFKVR